MTSISYPINFLARPADRYLIERLRQAGYSQDSAEILLYRIWQDFASGGSDRRQLSGGREDFASDLAVKLLEDFCKWVPAGEKPGMLVEMACAADFLGVEATESGETVLVCRDFYPLNSRISGKSSIQSLGGYSKGLSFASAKAAKDTAEHLQLWEHNPNHGFEDFTPALREAALLFIHRICRAAAREVPPDSVLRAGLFRTAGRCLDQSTQKQVHDTLLYLVSLRNKPNLPASLEAILNQWSELVARATKQVFSASE
jgi:hypothetical protein